MLFFCLLVFLFREEESKRKEADLCREMEEREKHYRETVERLQMQVSGALSILHGCTLLSLPFLFGHCLTLFISDSTAGEEGARNEEHHRGHK